MNAALAALAAPDVFVRRDECDFGELGFDQTWSMGDYMRLTRRGLVALRPGDTLLMPHDFGQAWVELEVVAPRLWSPWEATIARSFPAYPIRYPPVTVVFLARTDCPACDTVALHDAVMPDFVAPESNLAILQRRYVLRTCITCDNSWEQDAT